MEAFSALLAICAGNSPVLGEFPAQRPVTRSFDAFFDLRLNKDWVNNREAGDLRRYCAHYDVNVMDLQGTILQNDDMTWKTFCASGPVCDGNPPVTGGFPPQSVSNEEFIYTFTLLITRSC